MATINHPNQALFDFVESLPPVQATGKSSSKKKRSTQNPRQVASASTARVERADVAHQDSENSERARTRLYRPPHTISILAVVSIVLFYVQLGSPDLIVSGISIVVLEFEITDKATLMTILAVIAVVATGLFAIACTSCLLESVGHGVKFLPKAHAFGPSNGLQHGHWLQIVLSCTLITLAAGFAMEQVASYGGSISQIIQSTMGHAQQGRDVEAWQKERGGDVEYWKKDMQTKRLNTAPTK